MSRMSMKACFLHGLSASYSVRKCTLMISLAVSLTLTLSIDRLCFKDLQRAVS